LKSIQKKKSKLLEDAVALQQAGQLTRAITSYRRYLQYDPNNAGVLHVLGGLYYQVSDPQSAGALLEQAHKLAPDNTDYLNDVGAFCLMQGNFTDATRYLELLVSLSPDDPQAHYNHGLALHGAGRLADAVAAFERAVALQPDHAEALYNLGATFQQLGQLDDAIVHFNKALESNSDYAEAHNNLGAVLAELHLYDAAIVQYETALKINPDYALAHCNIAAYYEEMNNLDESAVYVRKALEIQPDNPFAHRLAATILRRTGKYKEALEKLQKIPISSINTIAAINVHFELGYIFDHLNDSNMSFYHFKEGNQLQAKQHISTRYNKNTYINTIQNLKNKYTKDWVQSWSTLAVDKQVDAPVFLIGFPRSGTTLLDQILDGHPRIQVIEEKNMLAQVVAKTASCPKGYPYALADFDDNNISELRQEYLHLAEKYIIRQADTIVIDKFPLNIVHVGLISRIYPQAKLILAVRHPLDVCLSCFMQYFEINAAMVNFFTIEDAAELYIQVMGLWKKYAELLPLDFHVVKYESLVENLEETTIKLFRFLNIDWDPAVLNYSEHAKKRGKIKTPSYRQVTNPIYQTSKYRWRRYSEQLTPIKEKLKPFIEYFDYDTD
jgi:tetratricopeptide (TPR) repeat protein